MLVHFPSGFPIILKEPVKALFEQVTGRVEDYVYLPVSQTRKRACSYTSALFPRRNGWWGWFMSVQVLLGIYNSALNQFLIFAFTLTRSLLKTAEELSLTLATRCELSGRAFAVFPAAVNLAGRVTGQECTIFLSALFMPALLQPFLTQAWSLVRLTNIS